MQSHLCEDDDAAQHFFEAANGPFRVAFSINDHTQEITFGLSADGDPLQLAEQGSELWRTEAAGRALRKIAQGLGIFVKNCEDRSAGEAQEMFAPVGRGKSGARLGEVGGIVRPGHAVVAEEREERGARRAANRHGIDCFSAGTFERTEFRAVGLDFFSVEAAVGDCGDSRGGSFVENGDSQAIEIALVIEASGRDKLRVVAFGRRTRGPSEELQEKGRRTKLREVKEDHGVRIGWRELEHLLANRQGIARTPGKGREQGGQQAQTHGQKEKRFARAHEFWARRFRADIWLFSHWRGRKPQEMEGPSKGLEEWSGRLWIVW